MDLTHIAETLSGLTVMQAAELVKMLEQQWGVSPTATGAAAETPHFCSRIMTSTAACMTVSADTSSATVSRSATKVPSF